MQKLEKREWIAVGIALVVATVLFFGGQIWDALFGTTEQTASVTATSTNQITMQNTSTVQGLEVYDEQVGTGTEATSGKTVTVHYVGYLANGTKFDSSIDRKEPFPFTLGAGQVIKGWDLGVAGMKVGGIRRLVISPELAYGNRAIGPIPANSTLVFEVQLLDVK